MPRYSALAGLGMQNVEASAAIRDKMKMMDEYKKASIPAPAPKAPSRPAGGDRINPGAKYGDRGKEKRISDKELQEMRRPLGSFKTGGVVKKTGVYMVHRGERVLNPKQTKKAAKSGMMNALAGR